MAIVLLLDSLQQQQEQQHPYDQDGAGLDRRVEHFARPSNSGSSPFAAISAASTGAIMSPSLPGPAHLFHHERILFAGAVARMLHHSAGDVELALGRDQR